MTAFVQESVVTLSPDTDPGAPGAAITVALCGSAQHDGPCPLSPHGTTARRNSDELRLRTVFVVAPELEDQVRRSIADALATAELDGCAWHFRSSSAAELTDDERATGARIGSNQA